MLFEEIEHRSGEQAHGQKRQDKPDGIDADEREAFGHGSGGAGHQQNAAQGGTDAGRPGKAECKAEQQRRKRAHRQAIQPEKKTVLFAENLRLAEYAELIDTEQNHDDTADAGKPDAVVAEEAAQGVETEPQYKEGEADAQDKKHGVDEYPTLPVADGAVFLHRFGAARQIAHIQGHERQHTGGEEAEQPLNKHGENWHAGFDVKTHSISFTCCGFIRR